MRKIDFKSELNKVQLEAVRYTDGPLLVISGPGSGKCVAGSSLIFTNKGIIKIQDIPSHFKVNESKCKATIISHDLKGNCSLTKTSNWYNMGEQKTFTITSRNGYSVTGTYEHPVLTLTDDGDLKFKQLKDILVGDYIVLSRNNDLWSDSDQITEPEATLLGLFTANGVEIKDDWLSFTYHSPFTLYSLLFILFNDFNLSFKDIVYDYRLKKVTIKSTELTESMLKAGLNLKSREIPSTVLRSSKKIVSAFISAFVSIKGRVVDSLDISGEITTLKQLQVVLLNYGILSNINSRKKLVLVSQFARMFNEQIKLTNTTETEKLDKLLEKSTGSFDSYPCLGKILTKNLGKSDISDRMIRHYKTNSQDPSGNKVLELAESVRFNSVRRYLTNLATNTYIDEVVAKEQGKAEVFDFTVPNTHSFVANGIVNHNTRLLTYKVSYLISELSYKPENILLLTFTRKSSEEMIKRASTLLNTSCKVSGGTFHSFAFQCLNRYKKELGFDNLTIIDEDDSITALSNVLKDHPGLLKPKIIHKLISSRLMTRKSYSKIVKNKDVPVSDRDKLELVLPKIEKEFMEYKKKHDIVSFDDLILYLNELVHIPKINKALAARFKYVLVDEFQDSDMHQVEIAHALVKTHGRITCTGDDAQSIYSFRNADVRNMLTFPERFDSCKIIKMEQNYRSIPSIVELTNRVMDKATEKFEKNLFTNRVSKKKPTSWYTPNKMLLDIKTVDLIEEHLKLTTPNEIAVLCRVGHGTAGIEMELNSRRIPFVKYGGLRFSETAHVKDVVAFLRVVFNSRDIMSLHRVLCLIPGVGSVLASKISDHIHNSVGGFKTIAKTEVASSTKGKQTKFFLEKVGALLVELDKEKKLTPSVAVSKIIEAYKPLLNLKYKDASKRYDELIRWNEVTVVGYKSIGQFINTMTLDPDLDKVEHTEKVIVSSIHSSKGLEFDTIILTGLEEGILPSKWSNSDRAIEEERRLFYVAVSRAKDNLHLMIPSDINQSIFAITDTKRSRFLDEIDLEQLTVQKQVMFNQFNQFNDDTYQPSRFED